MDTLSEESFNLLLTHAGLEIPQSERARLKPLYDQYISQLQTLHGADVDGEEVSGVFSSQWSLK